ncbi:MAG: hypothetical protein QXZ44_03700, partial [Ferroplasma sp.]
MTRLPEPVTSPEKPRSTNKKWHAVIIVLILVLSSFVVLAAVHPVKAEPEVKTDAAGNYLAAGDEYNLTLLSNQPFNNLTIQWGDNTNTSMNYSSSTVYLTHKYMDPGVYYISYSAYFGS